MNNNYAMSASFEARKNQQAAGITAAVAGLLVLMMIFLKWAIPTFVQEIPKQEMYIDLNLPEEPPPPPARSAEGGGGGGNEVQAPDKPGVAEPSPPNPGTTEDSRDVDDLPADKTSTPVLKPDVPKPDAKKVGENKAPITPPKPDPKPPAPPRPRNVMRPGQTTNGNNTGGNEAVTNFPRSGGRTGGGNGVGDGPGSGGNRGGGTGGGIGSGVGVTRGDRSIVGTYNFQGDLEKATIYAEVKVSANGVGEFIQFSRGTTHPNSTYREAVIRYLRQIKFNKSDHESTVTVRFNFEVSG